MPDDFASSSETPPPRTTGGNWRWEPPTATELQKLMPGYTIEKLLGRGGMGAVYRGIQTNLDRPVAIKILPPGVEKEDPSFAERFKSEARLMAKLNHPAVVAVYDFGSTSAGQLYFAMEYVDGSDVSQMLATQGRLPPEHALAITAHVCDGLSAAHELGIVHRDIKPANVLINQKGQVKVADFGLAKVEEPGQHGLTKTGFAMGTPDFVAPEALTLGSSIDGRADLYAVGVMLYQMLTGNIPRGAFKPASVLVPSVDPRFDRIILKAMQHDREERHQSAAELRAELDVILTVPLVKQSAPEPAAVPTVLVAQTPAQRSAAQKPAAQPPAAQKPAPQKSAFQAPPPKSKAPLLIGLAAAAAVGVGAFVMLGGKKDAAGTSASAVSAKSSRLSASTEAWQDMLRDRTVFRRLGAVVDTPEGLRFPATGEVRFLNAGSHNDGAVRILASSPNVHLHARINGPSVYALALDGADKLALTRWDNAAKKSTLLRQIPLAKPVKAEEEYELELRAVGPELTAKFNGEVVGTAIDATCPEGGFSVFVPDGMAHPVEIKAVQVLDLGVSKPATSSGEAVAGSAPAKTSPSRSNPALSPSSEPWQDMLAASSKVTPLGSVAITPAGLRFSNTGEVRFERPNPKRDGAVRMVATYNGGYIQLQARLTAGNVYQLVLGEGGNKLKLARWDSAAAKSITLREIPLPQPVKSGQDFELELRVVGPVLTAKFNGAVVGSATDGTYAEGGFSVRAGEKNTTPTLVKALEVLDLGEVKPAASSASPVAASSASPHYPPGKWVKAFTKEEDLPSWLRKEGMKLEDGWIKIPDQSRRNAFVISDTKSNNTVVRARIRIDAGELSAISIRNGADINAGDIDHNHRILFRATENGSVGASFERMDQAKGPGFTPTAKNANISNGSNIIAVELGSYGNRVVARVNNQILGVVNEEPPSQTAARYYGNFDIGDIEVMNLDGLPEAEALKILGVNEQANDVRNVAVTSAETGGKYPEGRWVKVFTQEAEARLIIDRSAGGLKWSNGEFSGSSAELLKLPAFPITSNHAIRFKMKPDDLRFGQVRLRDDQDPKGMLYTFGHASSLKDGVAFFREERVSGSSVLKRTELAAEPAAAFWTDPKPTEWEVGAVGGQLIARMNGKVILRALSGPASPGHLMMGGIAGNLSDIEAVNLDGLSEAEALKIVGVDDKGHDLRGASGVAASLSSPVPADQFPLGQWVKLFTKDEDLPVDLRKPDSGVKFEKGWIIPEKAVGLKIETDRQWSNAALRCRVRVSDQRLTVPSIRGVGKPFQNYQLNYLSTGAWRLSYFNSTAASAGVSGLETLSQFPGLVPFGEGSEHVLELAALNQRLIARGDARLLPVTEHGKLPKGIMSLFLTSPTCEIEVMNLDGLPEVEALRLLGIDEKGNDVRGAVVAQEQQKQEQATQAENIAAIPELKALHDQLVKLTAERVTGAFDVDVGKLNNGYRSGIDREIANEKKAGHLDGVLALEAEKQLLADGRRVPAKDTDATTPVLKKLRIIYREAYDKIEAVRVANLKALIDPLSLRLKQLESTLTQQDRVADAKSVREYREKLSAAPQATEGGDLAMEDKGTMEKKNGPPPARPSAPPDRGAPKKFPRGDDRKAAEWVINLGGKVVVKARDEFRPVSVLGDLPAGKFDVTEVRLEFGSEKENGKRPNAQVDDLLPLAGLEHLRTMNLRYFPVTDAHFSILSSLPELAVLIVDYADLTDAVFEHLSSAPTLTAVTLRNQLRLKGEQTGLLKRIKNLRGLSLQGCKLSDAGFAALAQLPELEELQLPATGMTDAHLASLRDFKKLAFLNLRSTAVSAAAVVPMRNLGGVTRLGLEFTPGQMVQEAAALAKAMPKVSGWGFEKPKGEAYSAADISGMAAFSQLRSIECYDQRFDAAAAGFLDLPELQDLIFDHTMLTDATLAALAGHKALTTLRLRSLQAITDKGLAGLVALKSLGTLEIATCAGLTNAGIADFRKQRPDVNVIKK